MNNEAGGRLEIGSAAAANRTALSIQVSKRGGHFRFAGLYRTILRQQVKVNGGNS